MERVFGGIFVRESGHILETGFVMDGHTHNFDHITYFPMGMWEVHRIRKVVDAQGNPKLDEKGEEIWHEIDSGIIKAGAWLPIAKNDKHWFKLLEGPGMYHCIYAHRNPDSGEVVNEYNGWHGAYG